MGQVPGKKIGVLIVDDSALAREALGEFLGKDPDISVLGAAENGVDGVAKAMELKPDVITMDINMPVMNGIEAIKKIIKEMTVPIIVVSTMEEKVLIEAVNAGAADFISIKGDIEKVSHELIRKIKSAYNKRCK